MNKKGQALVEFIIILPVILMLILALFDYVKIVSVKVELDDALDSYILDEDYTVKNDISITKEDSSYYVSKKVDISSPILSWVIDSPYNVVVKRQIDE